VRPTARRPAAQGQTQALFARQPSWASPREPSASPAHRRCSGPPRAFKFPHLRVPTAVCPRPAQNADAQRIGPRQSSAQFVPRDSGGARRHPLASGPAAIVRRFFSGFKPTARFRTSARGPRRSAAPALAAVAAPPGYAHDARIHGARNHWNCRPVQTRSPASSCCTDWAPTAMISCRSRASSTWLAVGPVRFVFPHAPVRPVTINGGYAMRAWYDILGTDLVRREDEAGMRSLLGRGPGPARPGGRARHCAGAHRADGFFARLRLDLLTGLRAPQRLAGLVGLSGYLPLADRQRHSSATRPIAICRCFWRMAVLIRSCRWPAAKPRAMPSSRWATRCNGTSTRWNIPCAQRRSRTSTAGWCRFWPESVGAAVPASVAAARRRPQPFEAEPSRPRARRPPRSCPARAASGCSCRTSWRHRHTHPSRCIGLPPGICTTAWCDRRRRPACC
jgi:hypothetical protein